MDSLLVGLVIAFLILSSIAIILSCVSIAIVVGLKNSTHRIEWKTFDPYAEGSEKTEDIIEDEIDEPMLNPNRRVARAQPFTPFPTQAPEEEPFTDADDPNNIVHDFNS